MTYTKTVWVSNTNPPINASNLNKIENALESALANSGVSAGTYTFATITVTADGKISFASSGAPGAIADASTTVKGASKASVAPASATNPIFVGDNDPRIGAATTTQRALQKTSTTPATAGDPISVAQNDPVLETYIHGLSLAWNSGTSLSVNPGAAWIPSLSEVYNVPSAITKSSLTFTASHWSYIYLFDNAGTPDIQIVDESTTNAAPSAVYKGVARTRTADTSKRFLGAFRSNAAGTAMLKFVYRGDWVEYREDMGVSPNLLLSNGSATTETTVSASAVVPTTAQRVVLHCRNDNATTAYFIGSSEDTITSLAVGNYLARIFENTGVDITMALDSSQALAYKYPSANSGAYISARAYMNER